MENNQQKSSIETYAIPIFIAFIGLGVLALQWQGRPLPFGEDVAPAEGVELPVVWGDMGKRLVESGAIDREKWLELYGSLTEEEKRLLDGNTRERLRITHENAPYLLNLLWAFGLANTNPILEDETEMMNPDYGGAGGFASTGGWTLSKGDPIGNPSGSNGAGSMEHYGAHVLVKLTDEQQALVEKISRGIYRPCCDNSTHFPDCNHGMAMLGLLELMASQGASEEEMWSAALAVNSYWFPDTYLTIAAYKKGKGTEWSDVDPQEVLGYDYSSATGFSRVATEVAPRNANGASCGV